MQELRVTNLSIVNNASSQDISYTCSNKQFQQMMSSESLPKKLYTTSINLLFTAANDKFLVSNKEGANNNYKSVIHCKLGHDT